MSLSSSLSSAPSSASRRRVLFLNDLGFQYGAGIAAARQIQSFLEAGWEVGALAWEPGELGIEAMLTRPPAPDLWLGVRRVPRPLTPQRRDHHSIITGPLIEVARFNPQVVIAGNLHSARWPLQLLTEIRNLGPRVIAYMHDGYLFTGRCPYPGDCRLYLSGCNATCPTATEYPALPPDEIAPQWQLRRDIFGGENGVEVAANSHWTRDTFRRALPHFRSCETIYLAADERVYQPADKTAARVALGLPNDKPIVLCAAVNFREKRKGADHLRRVVTALSERVHFAAFGHNTAEFPGMIGLGYHTDQQHLARLYQAADIYLGSATEEAFGQTILEAQLCGRPVVAFDVGGVSEIVTHNETGLLIPLGDSDAMIAAVGRLAAEPQWAEQLGAAGRRQNEHRFSLAAQAAAWEHYLAQPIACPPKKRPLS